MNVVTLSMLEAWHRAERSVVVVGRKEGSLIGADMLRTDAGELFILEPGDLATATYADSGSGDVLLNLPIPRWDIEFTCLIFRDTATVTGRTEAEARANFDLQYPGVNNGNGRITSIVPHGTKPSGDFNDRLAAARQRDGGSQHGADPRTPPLGQRTTRRFAGGAKR